MTRARDHRSARPRQRAVGARLARGQPPRHRRRGDQAGRDRPLHLLAARADGVGCGVADRALRAGAGGRGLVPGHGVADGRRDDRAGGGAGQRSRPTRPRVARRRRRAAPSNVHSGCSVGAGGVAVAPPATGGMSAVPARNRRGDTVRASACIVLFEQMSRVGGFIVFILIALSLIGGSTTTSGRGWCATRRCRRRGGSSAPARCGRSGCRCRRRWCCGGAQPLPERAGLAGVRVDGDAASSS